MLVNGLDCVVIALQRFTGSSQPLRQSFTLLILSSNFFNASECNGLTSASVEVTLVWEEGPPKTFGKSRVKWPCNYASLRKFGSYTKLMVTL